MNDISSRLLKAIQDSGYSYGILAKMTGIPKSAIQRYAAGTTDKIPLDRLQLLASALDVPATMLMGWEEETKDDLQEEHDLLISIYDQLPPESRRFLLAQLRGALQAQKAQDDLK